ncbi:MAG: GGDEF domain-containing phosphodiesterase, partial [Acidaminobacteraceae bacterium]
GVDSKALIKNADIAMYKSKESGKGNYSLYNSDMLKNLDQTLRLTNDLHRAIDQGELEVYYQPQNDAFTHEIRGIEALVRWNHPLYGVVTPDLFIPIAEHTGLIMEIGGWVLDQSCKDFKKLREISSNLTSIGVNLSVNQIISHSLVKQVERTLSKNGVSPKHLELEITESFLLNDKYYILKILDELKALNVRIAVDDFGTDYSSLRYLKQLPLDRIKIAKDFVDGIGNSNTDEAIIAAIIFLGEKLNLNLIAEGVESREQLDFLSELGCEEIQGFYFHKPMRFNELKDLMIKNIEYSADVSINSVKNNMSV